MRPEAAFVDEAKRPLRSFYVLVPGLKPSTVVCDRKGKATVDFQRAWREAFGETLPDVRIEEDGRMTRDFRNRFLAAI